MFTEPDGYDIPIFFRRPAYRVPAEGQQNSDDDSLECGDIREKGIIEVDPTKSRPQGCEQSAQTAFDAVHYLFEENMSTMARRNHLACHLSEASGRSLSSSRASRQVG